MKQLIFTLAFVLSAWTVGLAQKAITGTVKDDKGEPLIGATVLVKGTTVGTVTDIDGNFSLEVPEDAQTLVVSYTGYETKEVPLTDATHYDVVLSEGVALKEVVVTGLGIKREKKALGYGVSTLEGDALAERPETDIARIMTGKVTGVNVIPTSGLAGSGTSIIIRGFSSITGDNQPLFVVDGIPINAETNTDKNFRTGAGTASSRFLDIDPNNIKDISVLKGLAATTLYGELGRNGVILITTKTGEGVSTEKGMEVSFTQTIGRAEVANLPEYQNTYGNGFSGYFGWFFSNWGPAFSVKGSNGIDENGQIEHPYDQEKYHDDFPMFKGVRYDYKPYPSAENFFRPAPFSSTNVFVSKNLGKSSFSLNYTYTSDNGFTLPLHDEKLLDQAHKDLFEDPFSFDYMKVAKGGSSNYLKKHNFAVGASTELDNGFRISGSLQYINYNKRNPPAALAYGSGPAGEDVSLFSDVLYTPRSIDLLHLPYQSPKDGSMVYYRRGSAIQNPLWTLNNSWEEETTNRYITSVKVEYDLFDWLTFRYQLGVDQYNQFNEYKTNRGGSQDPDGHYNTSYRNVRQLDQQFNFLYNKQLTESIDISGVVGFNANRRDWKRTRTYSSNQFVFNLFKHDNFSDFEQFTYIWRLSRLGVYGTATLGYNHFLYIGLQGRNDWSSALEPENRSVFYPSVSVSVVPTTVLPMLQDFGADYLKLRIGYGTSAGFPAPYVTKDVLNTDSKAFITKGGATIQTHSVSNRLGNKDLKPERHAELEFGLEGQFFRNRLGVDFSWYNKNSRDLLIDLALDPATGYTVTTVNAAKVNNKGIELGLDITPVRGAFTWDMRFNYTKNRSTVLELGIPGEGEDKRILIAGFTDLGNFAIEGQPYGVIVGTPYLKTKSGQYLVNGVGEYIEGEKPEVIGDPNPNYLLDVLNTFSYKNFRLFVQVSYRDGGDIWSRTTATLLARGNTIDTDFDRFLPIVIPGVLAGDTTQPNNIQIYAGDAWFSGYFGADEGSIFDGTTIRLREVALEYEVPKNLLKNLPFGALSIKAFGRNLWYKAVNFPKGINFDPEVLSIGVGNGQGFDYLTGPTARRVGVTVNVKF